jgi:hypothetical protein
VNSYETDNVGSYEFAMAIRPGVATSVTFARATGSAMWWHDLIDDTTGQPYVSPGTFYTSTGLVESEHQQASANIRERTDDTQHAINRLGRVDGTGYRSAGTNGSTS